MGFKNQPPENVLLKKPKITDQHRAALQTELFNIIAQTEAQPTKFYRVKINGRFMNFNGRTRWLSEHEVKWALRDHIKWRIPTKIWELVPPYYKFREYRHFGNQLQDNPEGSWEKAYTVTSAEINKALDALIASKKIEIVEQMEL